MQINIYKDRMQKAYLFGTPVLYSEQRIPKEDIPQYWSSYELRGTVKNPGEPYAIADRVSSNFIGAILSPLPQKKDTVQSRLVKDKFELISEYIQLSDFCSEYSIPVPQTPLRHQLRPVSPEEAGFFYALPPEKDKELGVVGHVRIDFGRGGREGFYHTWWPRGPEELNTQEFRDELDKVVNDLRKGVLKDLVQCTVTCDDFHHWLLCVKTPATVHMEKEPSALLIKLEKSPSVLYLYRTSTVQDRGISWDNSMLFCGVFNKQSQALYLTKDALSICTDGQTRLVTTVEPSMSGEISGRINQRVEEIIANDRGNISVKKITESPALRDLQYYQEHGARESAIQLIFSDGVPDIRFHSDYKLDILPEAAFIAYIQDPENFVKEEAEQYIKANGERFLLQFLRNDALLEQYQALMQDTGNPIHRMKAITDAVKASGAKTVAATVQKDGMELTFRAVANSLTGHRNFYSTYNIPAQDRRIFEQMFGRYADFCAEDITRITYGKRTLYEAPAIQSEDMTEGMMMGGIS